jgi:hypothetical protein
MSNKKLEVIISSRGNEVYGLNYHQSNFNETKFNEEHVDDYYDLSGDTIESELPMESSFIEIYLDGQVICSAEYNYEDGIYFDNVKVIDNGYSESYRQLLNSEPNEVAVVWFHDYMNNQYYRWENIQEFDRNKLVVFSCQRIDDTDKNNKYPMVSHIIYDDKDADEIEMDGSPKTGYHGPYIIFP